MFGNVTVNARFPLAAITDSTHNVQFLTTGPLPICKFNDVSISISELKFCLVLLSLSEYG